MRVILTGLVAVFLFSACSLILGPGASDVPTDLDTGFAGGFEPMPGSGPAGRIDVFVDGSTLSGVGIGIFPLAEGGDVWSHHGASAGSSTQAAIHVSLEVGSEVVEYAYDLIKTGDDTLQLHNEDRTLDVTLRRL